MEHLAKEALQELWVKLEDLEFLAPWVLVVTPVPLAIWVCLENEDPRESLDHKDHLVPQERQDVMDHLAPQEKLAHQVYRAPLVPRELVLPKEIVATPDLLERLDPQVLPVVLDLLVILDLKDCLVSRVHLEKQALVERSDFLEVRVTLVHKDTPENKEPLENLASQARMERRATWANLELLEPWVNLDSQEPLDHQETRATKAPLDPPGHKEHLANVALVVNQVPVECPESREHQVFLV